MSTATDAEILAYALARNATVVTLDADFHAILAVTGASRPSVIRIRMQSLGAKEISDHILVVCNRFEKELTAGAMVTVKPRKTTCHRLPIGRSE
jgi:predicted nuclease of predicted toxin-antitoxin system